MKYLIIDNRMRKIEKEVLKSLEYDLIELPKNNNLYAEISSHTDILCSKVNDKLIVEKNVFEFLNNKLQNKIKVINGEKSLSVIYPNDIAYNVCIVGKKAIHNFKYTDYKVLEELKKENYELINVKQGYSNCSIAVIDDNSIITADYGLYHLLRKYDLNVLFLDYNLDIKLLNGEKYSNMKGFIGGAVSRIGNNVFISGELRKIDINNKIKYFIEDRNLRIIDFKGLDLIDYGGIIELK